MPVWLQLAAGAIAILAFLGIADYHQLAAALGWQKTHAAPPRPSPTPTVPPVPQSTGPVDPQDTATCTAARSAIHTLQTEVPMGSYTADWQFYLDQTMTFYSLGRSVTTVDLSYDLLDIQGATAALAAGYRHKALGESTAHDDMPYFTHMLAVFESKTESFCAENTGSTG